MATYTFDYTENPIDPSPAFPDGTKGKRPLLNVTLINGDARVSCIAGVDTMADFTTFPMSYMATLGIDPSTALPGNLVGVGSQPRTLFHAVDIEFTDLDFFRITVYAGFSEGLDSWGVGLLGQNGFFDRMKGVGLYPDFFSIET